mgnify:CR=1 FL=1
MAVLIALSGIGIYDIFFSRWRNKKFNFAEIGIGTRSTGLRMFREYFKKARIFGFELEKANIKFAKKLKLKKSYYITARMLKVDCKLIPDLSKEKVIVTIHKTDIDQKFIREINTEDDYWKEISKYFQGVS